MFLCDTDRPGSAAHVIGIITMLCFDYGPVICSIVKSVVNELTRLLILIMSCLLERFVLLMVECKNKMHLKMCFKSLAGCVSIRAPWMQHGY